MFYFNSIMEYIIGNIPEYYDLKEIIIHYLVFVKPGPAHVVIDIENNA
jgi:hypothetical protein